jgi:phosphoglycerol transferase MdoB-like AlkP superfamily enzyme
MKFKSLINPPRVVLYWTAVILLGLLFFAFFRMSFLFRHWHLAPGIPLGDIAVSFLLGIKFDLSVLASLALPFFIFSSIPIMGFEKSRLVRVVIQIILYTVFSLFFLLSLIDIEYYRQFGDHLGIWFYSYLDNVSLVWYGVSNGFPWVRYVIAWAVITAVFVLLASRLNRIFERKEKSSSSGKIVYGIIGAASLALAMRGSVTLAPLDWGSAYHSNYGFANDLSLNGVFTLSRSLYESYNDTDQHNPVKFHFMPTGEALKTVQQTLVAKSDSLIHPDSTLRRQSVLPSGDSLQYNVVIIVLESWSAKFVGALGGHPNATPFFDSLAQKSILFDNFFASGLRTNRGLLSVLCSFPSLPGRTVMKRYGAPHPFRSIADILGEKGYESYFIYGGDLGFENMQGFFRGQGFTNFIGIQDFQSSDVLNKWGVPDHIVLSRANKVFSESKKPFVAAIVTLTNHEPFVLPGKEFEVFPKRMEHSDYLNTFHYSDWALGQFFSQAEKEEYFKNTIFVLVGDHGKVLGRSEDMLHNFRIASLIYCPGMPQVKPRVVETVCGQVDILPTVLGLLGDRSQHESWGRDILATESMSFAFLNKNDSYAWIEDSVMVREEAGGRAGMYAFPSDSLAVNDISKQNPEKMKRLQQKGRAMLQLEVEMVHIPGAD